MNKLVSRIIIVLAIFSFANIVFANEDTEKYKYLVGGHSMLINGNMKLSRIDPSFDDLTSGDLESAHHSSLFFMLTVNQYLRIGVETLTGNSDVEKNTTMNFQGVGGLIDTIYGDKYFVTGGVHAGAIIVNAMSRSGIPSNNGVNTGTYYKDTGLFVAPYFGIGVKINIFELSLVTKWLEVMSGDKSKKIDAFSAQYMGLGFGIRF